MNSNFLFIIADDLNSWVGPLGRQPDVRTPHIDALAREGTVFLNAFCSAPYCNASRMGIFTGCLPSTTGIYHDEPLWEEQGHRPTFIELLRSQGYYTMGAGKVFHGAFDYATANRYQLERAEWRDIENRAFLWDEFYSNHSEPLPLGRPLNKFFDLSDFDSVPPPYYQFDWGAISDEQASAMPDIQVRDAVKAWLHKQPRQPFFCAAGFYKPHLPWHVPQRFFDLYDRERLSLPPVKNDDLDDVPPIARSWALSPRDHELVTSRNQWRHAVHGYLAAVTYVDELIGSLVAAVVEAGLASNTYIVLLGDNGFHLGEKLHWRKFTLWDEATRVPLIIVPPASMRTPQRVLSPVSLIDLFPTLLGLANVTAPETDGISLVPMLTLPEVMRARPVVMTWGLNNHSVRDPRWRFTRYSDGAQELYDHEADPHEWTNLAALPEFAAVRERLAQELPVTQVEDEFVEESYLAANPDVAAAVREGHFVSGHQHWETHGRTEGRPLVPKLSSPQKLHMKVDFFVAGVQKGGTTALHRMLGEHPALEMSNVKELHYFDDDSLNWSTPDYSRLHEPFDWRTQAIRGEATPIYTYWPNAIERLHRYNPDAKLIILLRHPVFRAFSHWRMAIKQKWDTWTFAEAIAPAGRDRVRNAPGGTDRYISYVERSFYAPQMERVLQFYPQEKILFLRTDHLWSENQRVLDNVQSFLGVPLILRGQARYIVPTDSRDVGTLPMLERRVLEELYEEDITETSRLTGLDLADWLSPTYEEPMTPD